MVTVGQLKTETLTLNMGPQHPSTHGVLRLVLTLDGERVVDCKPQIGYLHTGIEKQCEYKPYRLAIPLTDRLDYLSAMTNNLAYCLCVEQLLEIEIPRKAQWVRVCLSELSRIASHLVWLGTHALDIGAMSVFLYCFREREQIMDTFDAIIGGRLTPSYFTIGGLRCDLPADFNSRVQYFIGTLRQRLSEYEGLLTQNPIWLARTRGLGVISAEKAIAYGVTGPLLRACGVPQDLRKTNPYSSYEEFDFQIALGTNGDVYDRYLVRVEEMRQSLRIVEQALEGMPEGPYITDEPTVAPPTRQQLTTQMEALIRHFKIWTEGFSPKPGEAYVGVEGPKGEIGFYIVSDGSNKPWRVRIRPPSFLNLQALPELVRGHLVADVVAVIGSLDIVLGEIDR